MVAVCLSVCLSHHRPAPPRLLVAAAGLPALVVTSGGLISCVMRHVLRLDIEAMAQLALAIYNTSLHRLFPIGGRLSPTMFNAIPHLEDPSRHYAQTHV